MQLKSSWGLPLTFDKYPKVFVDDSHTCLRSTLKVRSCIPTNFLPPSISPPNKNKAWLRYSECQALLILLPPLPPSVLQGWLNLELQDAYEVWNHIVLSLQKEHQNWIYNTQMKNFVKYFQRNCFGSFLTTI